MRIAIFILCLIVLGCSSQPDASDRSDQSFRAGEVQKRQLYKQDPTRIDLSLEAVELARQIVSEEEGLNAEHTFECAHDFWSPFPLAGFVPKNGRVFIVRVGGYDTKDAEGTINRFLWINDQGKFVWEP